MDVNIYLMLGAVLIVAIIVLNHQKQKNKMKTMLEEAGGTQQIFLTKAVEKKNKALADILYDGGIKPLAANTGTTSKDMLIKRLERLEKEFAAKKISLRVYDEQLFDLLEKANKLAVLA